MHISGIDEQCNHLPLDADAVDSFADVLQRCRGVPWILESLPVAGADRYRVTLFDGGGRVLFETQLADTLAALPDSILLDPGRPYLWKVEARTGWQRWSASGLVEFSIAGGPPR